MLAESHSVSRKGRLKVIAVQNPLDLLENDVAATKRRSGSYTPLELILHAPIGRMLAVLDLDPVLRSSGAILAIRPLRHHVLKAHVARGHEQVRTDFALLEQGEPMPELEDDITTEELHDDAGTAFQDSLVDRRGVLDFTGRRDPRPIDDLAICEYF